MFGLAAADFMSAGRVALRVLKEPIVSISRTVRKAFEERPEIGEIKLPAAPALGRDCQPGSYSNTYGFRMRWRTYMT